ncbi:MAG: alanine racemase [Candidatus Omnitrophota bacterium]|jgi:alanine racemase
MPDKKEIGYRPTWAEVDLNNLADNFRKVGAGLAPKTKILVTVKADAYGHGLIPVSKKLAGLGVDFLGVASIDEGIKLRQAGINIPVLILGVVLNRDISPIAKFGLTPTVCDEASAAAFSRLAKKAGRLFNLHVKVDTGMGRIGVQHKDAFKLLQKINRFPFIRIEGIFTHFPLADINKRFTCAQIRVFDQLVEDLKKSGITIPLVHAANSVGLADYKDSHFTMVRPGLVIYGLYPKEDLGIKLKPVLSLKSRVIFVKDVPKGFGVSYAHAYVTRQPGRIVTLPIGYGDGYPRNLSNKAPVLIGGRRFRISGRICMDQIMVDVGSYKVRVGEEAVLIGRQNKAEITTEELAQLSGTIPYEISCGLGSRIPRVYRP